VPPKTRVHDFKLEAAIRALDTAAPTAAGATNRLELLYLCTAMVILVWPVRPHSLVSCATAGV
jgi:hypothetical protein